jgi:Predicted transcriptional regulator containing an HTH domain and an uncharacterized domain shared with the mammalian protein Schlafen
MLDFLTPDGKYNVVAFLFADNNNISVRIGKYAGADKLDLTEREDFKDCCFVTALQKVLDRFDIENVTQSRKRPMRSRLDKRLVDSLVLHEVIINAFAHNDYTRLDTPIFQIYSDRFEVTSFGGLVEGLSLENFYEGTSMPRNREIMRVLKDLEFVEQLGSGIPKIVSKYGRGVISMNENVVQTSLMFDNVMGEMMRKPSSSSAESSEKSPEQYPENEEQYPENEEKCPENEGKTTQKTAQKILVAISQNPRVSRKELAVIVNRTPNAVKRQLEKLKAANLIQRIGPDKGGQWQIKSNTK